MERFKEWTGLKSDLTNYRLNSSILVSQPASFGVGKPFLGVLQKVVCRGLLPQSFDSLFSEKGVYYKLYLSLATTPPTGEWIDVND